MTHPVGWGVCGRYVYKRGLVIVAITKKGDVGGGGCDGMAAYRTSVVDGVDAEIWDKRKGHPLGMPFE